MPDFYADEAANALVLEKLVTIVKRVTIHLFPNGARVEADKMNVVASGNNKRMAVCEAAACAATTRALAKVNPSIAKSETQTGLIGFI